jgi:hypothetical protein
VPPTPNFFCCHNRCLGGYYDAIGNALSAYDVVAAVANAVEFLRSFSPTDLVGRNNFDKLPASIEPPKKLITASGWIQLIHIREDDE